MSYEKMFPKLIKERDDSEELIKCMKNTVSKLLDKDTSSQNPGILLGKIQSGKTRAFIGVMALCFDNGYDASIILTKGTKALLKQTVQRMENDFKEFIEDDFIEVFDIMHMPDNLTAYERRKKLIIVVKKEVHNMKRILEKLANVYPDIRQKKILIIDDEADFASLSFKKHNEAVEVGIISSKIDELRNIVNEVDYLQVTATPYSLYLQPTFDENNRKFLPKRPAFTILCPIHEKYIGGQFYFKESENEKSIAYDVYQEVSPEERDILKQPDARRLRLEDVLISDKIETLRTAIVNFIVGSVIRIIQQRKEDKKPQKYAFVSHCEISRKSHEWQAEIIKELVKKLASVAREKRTIIEKFIEKSYQDLKKSLNKLEIPELPTLYEVKEESIKALLEEKIIIVVVNSDKDVEELLDNNGQLKLRNPMNIFIGGQILDRGVTISNLIGFYYGRKPKRFQQDTVLQHSRMYGARPERDLSVTRFYTTRDIYEVMKRIYRFDSALREAFELGSHEKGIYFIRKDVTGRLVPCSPNKLLLSSLATLRPYRRMLPVGFQTRYKTHIESIVYEIDNRINSWFKGKDKNIPIKVSLKDTLAVIDLIEKTLELDSLYAWNWNTFKSSIEHLAKISKNLEERGFVWIILKENMNISREKTDGRLQDDPDGGSGRSARTIAKEIAIDIPALILSRENGLKEKGWRDTPFWWPVLMNPENTEAAIFAEETI